MHFNISKGGAFILSSIEKKKGEASLRWEANVISRVPEERLIVTYTLYRGKSKIQQLIGKFYAGDVGQAAYRAMSTLQQVLVREGANAILASPEPLFYNATLDLIVQQFVEGVPYYGLVRGERAPFYFIEAGKTLAFLHRLVGFQYCSRRFISDHLEELIHPHPLLFADIMPAYRPTVEALVQEMTKIEESWGSSTETTPIHRDFHLRQLFHDEKQVWLIDWDLFAMGDPALDIGNFIVYLETRLPEKQNANISAFLEGYVPHAPAARFERVPVYKAFTYLRLACKRFRLKEEGWREKVPEMLHRSEMALKGGLYV